MAFEFGDQHIHEYHTRGYTVLRDLIPPALLADLRREADRGRPIARQLHGGNAQRLQPIAPHLDMRPFDALDALPDLQRALRALFEHDPGMQVDLSAAREHLGILYEPGDSPYCMGWHRDYRDLWPGMDLAKWQAALLSPRMFNQTNVALYDDGCLWAVPGSHLRGDTPAEIRRFPDRPVPYPDCTGLTPEAAELACRAYVQSMPGAEQVRLNAGDFMLYRNTLWHIGCYVPYVKRATIHGALLTPEYLEFFERDFKPVLDAAIAGRAPAFVNLNAHTDAYRESLPGVLAARSWQRVRGAAGWLKPRIKRRLGL